MKKIILSGVITVGLMPATVMAQDVVAPTAIKKKKYTKKLIDLNWRL